MLKLIPAGQLQLGMYVHELCGSWFNHPFWREAFLLNNANTLKEVLSSGIREVWIDTDKGLDCEGGKSKEMLASKVDGILARANASDVLPVVEEISISVLRNSGALIGLAHDIGAPRYAGDN